MTERIRNIKAELLSDNWYTLKKYSYDYLNSKRVWEPQERETYDRGNGATILLYNTVKRTIILTRQFRLPTYVNGNEGGFLVEACAGLLDGDNPLDCIKKEVIEETGYHVTKVEKIFEAYMSPGSVTEIIHFFIAKYDESLKKSDGGGVQEETEEIEILEMDFDDAMRRITSNEICDGKTIMLIYHLRVQGIL